MRRPALEMSEIRFQTFYLKAKGLLEEHGRLFEIFNIEEYIGSHRVILEEEKAGRLVIAEGSAEGRVRGYVIWLLGHHAGLKGVCARLGPWYVEPDWRGSAGLRLFHFSLDLLRGRGVRFAIATLPLRRKPKENVMERFGGKPFEMNYLLELESRTKSHG